MNNKIRNFIKIIALILLICISAYIFRNNENIKNAKLVEKNNLLVQDIRTLNNNTSESVDISEKYVDKSEYTKEYSNYLNMSKEEKSKVSVIPPKYKVKKDLLYSEDFRLLYSNINKNSRKIKASNNEYSSNSATKYDLRDVIGEISVSNQSNDNICWAYSSNKVLETHVKLLHNQTYNYSEAYLDYITSNLLYGNRNQGEGGNYDNAFEIITVNGIATEEVIPNDVSYQDRLEEITSAKCVTRILKYVTFPYINEASSSEEILEQRNAVKTHISKYGAVATYISSINKNNYNSEKYTYYCPSNNEEVWHQVTIIGWDDNFSKNNFLQYGNSRPQNDGAWLAMNSWGEEWGDNGFFWISYEDALVNSYIGGIIATENMHNYEEGYTYNIYYPSSDFTLKPYDTYIKRQTDLAVNFNRKNKNMLEYIDYIAISRAEDYIPSNTNIYINNKNSNLNESSETYNLEGIVGKVWSIYTPEIGEKLLTGDEFLIKLKSYGLRTTEIGGVSTYAKINSTWNKIEYTPQIVVYTHSYPIESIVTVNNIKDEYLLGENIDVTIGSIEVSCAEGKIIQSIPLSECNIVGFDTSSLGEKTININYGGKSIEYNINVKNVELESNIYEINNMKISNVNPKTSVAMFLNNIISIISDVKLKKNDKEMNSLDLVGTGCELILNDRIKYKLMVTGDVNGDGQVDMADLFRINSHRLSKEKGILKDEYFLAGDIDGNGKVNFLDMLKINNIRLKK